MSAPDIVLRAVEAADKDQLRVWRNLPEISAWMYSDHAISEAEHERWFNAAMADPAHRAGPDAWVTAHILMDLLKDHPVERLLEWTNAPRDLALVPFGKHRRKPWSEVPDDYLRWMATQTDMDVDAVTAARNELDKRKAA